MKNKVVVLDKNKKKDAYMSRKEYFDLYSLLDNNGCFKGIRPGAPMLITIDGSTYLLDKLPVKKGVAFYNDFIRECKSSSLITDYRILWTWM